MQLQHTPLESDQQALVAALAELLKPMAHLCISRGLTAPVVEEVLRRSFVEAARTASSSGQANRQVSRLSAITGLTRREVKRVENESGPAPRPTRSLATELLTRWASLPAYADPQTGPRVLRRAGADPSFESLAAGITRDVHPRTLLSELERLKFVRIDAEADTVMLEQEAFVPRSDWPRMMGFLGENVGDHLKAAVSNVVGTGQDHFEQSLLADELSEASLNAARQLITQQWRHLMTQLGPQLQALMDADRASGRPQDMQLRVGLYSWTQPMNTPPAPSTIV